MRRRWVEKNVNLTLLTKGVENFFQKRGYKTKKDESGEEHTILAIPQNVRDVREEITVRVFGKSNDFAVEFFAGERTRSSILLGFITSLIGGGSLLLRGLKSQEAVEKLEREFWLYAEGAIVEGNGSVHRR